MASFFPTNVQGHSSTPPHSVAAERQALLTTLPGEIITQIAFEACVIDEIGPPTEARALCLTCRDLNDIVSWRANHPLYATLFARQFDLDAPKRRCTTEDSLLPDHIVSELLKRWTSLTRMKRAVHNQTLSTVATADREADLWVAYILLMEDDGKNASQLKQYVDLDGYLGLYWREELLPAAQVKGFPADTLDKSLALWIMWFTCNEHLLLSENTFVASARLSALRPYAFAANHYDIFYAPWYERVMPYPLIMGHSALQSNFHQEAFSHTGACIEYFGQKLLITPLKAGLAAIILFNVRTSVPASVQQPIHAAVSLPNGQQAAGAATEPGAIPLYASDAVTNRGSSAWDIDWKRQVACWDLCLGKGLALEDTSVVGVWEGKFTFFDFDSYRDMLVGSHDAVYNGSFGTQPQIWRLQATRQPYDQSFRRQYLLERLGVAEDDFVRASHEANMDIDSEEPEWQWGEEEILLTGTGHSAWGQFNLAGNIRTWDGLVTLRKEYTPQARGTWLYRGYVIGGHYLVGRWRDTFTEKTQFGYEGIFAMARRS